MSDQWIVMEHNLIELQPDFFILCYNVITNEAYSVLSNDNFTIDNVLFYLKLHVSKALAEELYTIRPNYWVSIIELT